MTGYNNQGDIGYLSQEIAYIKYESLTPLSNLLSSLEKCLAVRLQTFKNIAVGIITEYYCESEGPDSLD